MSASAARLFAARACAWALLVAGWIGLGAFAFRLAPTLAAGFALIAAWLFALGGAAAVATRAALPARVRVAAIVLSGVTAVAALAASARGGGTPALAAATVAWAALTALASGVVRALRLAQPARPRPPAAAAAVGSLAAAYVLGDPGDLPALLDRLCAFVVVLVASLAVLPLGAAAAPGAPGCRAGLFDCSLPAWPAGAWRDVRQWPTLAAALAMLPMMAALPLMVSWCRSDALAPRTVVLAHVAAMFVPALALQPLVARMTGASLARVCTALLAAGGAALLAAPAPFDWLLLAVAHGAAWSVAWSGALWSPQRRAQQGSSPARAGLCYALLTLAAGALAERYGAAGIAAVHLLLAALAGVAWAASAMGTRVERLRAGAPSIRP